MRLHHIALSVTDADSTLRWYGEVFGVSVERIVTREDLGVKVYFLSGSDLRFEIFAFRDHLALPDYRKTVDADIRVAGTKHFAAEVDDINDAVARAIAAGSRHVEGPHLSWDGRNLYAFVSDPSGILVEFMQFPPPDVLP